MGNEHELTIELKLDGSTSISGDKEAKETKDGSYIQRFLVDFQIGTPTYFQVQLQMTEFKDPILLDKLKPGAEVELKVGYKEPAVIFKGETTYIEPHFAAGEMFVTLSGYDASHRLTRGTSSHTFGDGHAVDQNIGDIVKKLVGESKTGKGDKSDGLSATTSSTDTKVAYHAVFNQSIYQQLQALGGNLGLDFSTDEQGKLSIKPIEPGSPVKTICRDKFDPASEVQAITADFVVSTCQQVSSVKVRGWDGAAKKPIMGEATSASSVLGGTPGYEQAGEAHAGSSSAGRLMEIAEIPVSSTGEAKETAQAIFDKMSWDWQHANLVIQGDPKLKAGVVVETKDFGIRYSGPWLVKGCKHVFQAGSGAMFRTYLDLQRNGSPKP